MFNSLTIVIKIIGDTIKHIVIKDIVVSWSNMFTLKVMKFKIKLICGTDNSVFSSLQYKISH